MARAVAYEHVQGVLAEFSYPAVRDDVAAALADVTVTFDDGSEANLGVLVSETQSDVFAAVADVETELDELLQQTTIPE